jgi:hypothetical protein
LSSQALAQVLQIKIAGLVFSAQAEKDWPPLIFPLSHRPFQVADMPADVAIQIHYGDLPAVEPGEKVFVSNPTTWTIHRQGERFLLGMQYFDDIPHRLAIVNRTFTSGDLHILRRKDVADLEAKPDFSLDPFQYPFDELLMINFLGAHRLGVIAHALGVIDEGRGLLFCGVSGAGKSTLARLWQGNGATLLSDDRIILRLQGGRVWIHGTPWHGDAKISCPQGTPLDKLYFISHAAENRLSALSAVDAITRLLVRSFPPFYSNQGMANTLELISRMVSMVPCFALGFVPDESTISFIRGRHGSA